ncbi:MAG: SUMF1/EgtB/PvdO family nonheme iron enzyme [Treponema sp.]|nr:SUMF1/EgtB/PvdO family nonheme iron enzyme [Treponema sp.]
MKKTKLIAAMAMLMSAAVFTACNSALDFNESSSAQESQDRNVQKTKGTTGKTTLSVLLPSSKAASSRVLYSKDDVTEYGLEVLKNGELYLEPIVANPGDRVNFGINDAGTYKIRATAFMNDIPIAEAEKETEIDLSKNEILVQLKMRPMVKATDVNVEILWDDEEPETPPAQDDFIFVEGDTIFFEIDDFDVYCNAEGFGKQIIIDDFYICDHEVTQAEFESVMGFNPSHFSSDPDNNEVQANRPVECVSWYDAVVYCNRKSIAAGLTPCYVFSIDEERVDLVDVDNEDIPRSAAYVWDKIECRFDANGYRLPKEVEWQYAAVGGKTGIQEPTVFAGTNGNNAVTRYAWIEKNSNEKTHEVKRKLPNNLGIYDMSGNVWEWCWDAFSMDEELIGTPLNYYDRYHGNAGYETIRCGGSWVWPYYYAYVYSREYDYSYARESPNAPGLNWDLGFRLVRTAK